MIDKHKLKPGDRLKWISQKSREYNKIGIVQDTPLNAIGGIRIMVEESQYIWSNEDIEYFEYADKKHEERKEERLEEDPHKGKVYNPISETWSWL